MNDKLSYLSKYADQPKKKKKKEKKKSKKKDAKSSLVYDDDIDNDMGNMMEDELDQDNPIVVLPDGMTTTDLEQIMKKNQNQKIKSKSNFIPVNDVKNEERQRRRYDSDDESHDFERKSRRKNKRNKSKKYDSDSSASVTDQRQSRRSRRRSYSSSSDSSSSSNRNTRNVRRNKRRRYDSSSSENDERNKSNQTFTIYRDPKTGKRLNMDARYQNVISKHEQDQLDIIELNKGQVQKKQEEESHKRNQDIQQQPFARAIGDRDNDTKNLIRKDDPMMKLVEKRKKDEKSMKPLYKGPPPKPNRFNIKPGYRWDGIDRGNGFEDKVLALKYSKAQYKENAYKWSVADM